MRDGIPSVPVDLFLRESSRWVDPRPVWDRECPYKAQLTTASAALLLDEATELINRGAEYSQEFYDQSIRCWTIAEDMIRHYSRTRRSGGAQRDEDDVAKATELLDVAVGNRLFFAAGIGKPWSMPSAQIRSRLVETFGKNVAETVDLPRL